MKIIEIRSCLSGGSGPAAARRRQPQAFHSGGVAECGGCHSMHTPKAGGSLPADRHRPELDLPYLPRARRGHRALAATTSPLADADMPAGVARAEDPGRRLRLAEEKLHLVPSAGTTTTEHGDDARPQHRRGRQRLRRRRRRTRRSRAGPFFPSAARAARAATIRTAASGASATVYVKPAHRQRGSARSSAPAPITTAPLPPPAQAVGVYRLLRGAGRHLPGRCHFHRRADRRGPSTYNRTEAVTQTRVAYGARPGPTPGATGARPATRACTPVSGQLRAPGRPGARAAPFAATTTPT